MNPRDNLICIIMDKRIIAIKERLESEINSISLEIEDQGYMHKGHTAHTEGKMHIWVEIVSDDFIDSYIGLKMEDVTRMRMTPHPIEFDMYYSL